jgi:hypothetical protein
VNGLLAATPWYLNLAELELSLSTRDTSEPVSDIYCDDDGLVFHTQNVIDDQKQNDYKETTRRDRQGDLIGSDPYQ